MTYKEWLDETARKHRRIVDALDGASVEEIVDFFEYEHMRRHHADYCPLYAQGKKCHEMEDLNCYFCGCPYFRFCDEGIDVIDGKKRYSLCAIDAKEGKRFETEEAIHQDCSECILPHRRAFVRKHFDRDWKRAMRESDACGNSIVRKANEKI